MHWVNSGSFIRFLYLINSSSSSSSILQVVKVESGEPVLMPSQTAELHFLRSRVRELEREKAELSAENQRLNSMLVHGESPGPRPNSLTTSRSGWEQAAQLVLANVSFDSSPSRSLPELHLI